MKLNTRSGIAAIGVSGILALGVLGAGAVMAQESDGTPSDSDGQTVQSDRPHRPGPRAGGAGALFKASGLEASVFIEGFEQGLTVGEVLAQQGLDPDAVVSDALALLEERLANAVAEGHMDQATADEKLANAGIMLTALLDTTPQPHDGPGRGHGPGRPGHHIAGTAAEVLGLTPEELRDALSDGGTLADVANSLGVDVQAVIDGMLAPVFERIDEGVANGHLTAEEAEVKKAEATERITDIVNNGRPDRPGRGDADDGADTDAAVTDVA